MTEITRRDFVRTSAIGGLAAAAGARRGVRARAGHPARPGARPVIISSANGHEYRNGGPVTCVEHAFKLMTSGTDVLDALVAGVNIVELDPEETSVGYGGLAECRWRRATRRLLHARRQEARRRRRGARRRCVLRPAWPSPFWSTTDHHLIVGAGAQVFARNMGFTIEDDLNTPKSRGALARVEASG